MRPWPTTLLALCACNQVYGLDRTEALDASTLDAAYRSTRLSYQVGGRNAFANQTDVTLAPIMPPPLVRAGALDQPLQDVPYVDGQVLYPPGLVGTTWRLEYTAPGELVREVQWSPPDGGGHLTVPLFGSPARTKLAPGTGYQLTLPTTGFSARAVVYTTGYWLAATTAQTLTPVVDLSTTAPLNGPFGAPDQADVLAIVDYDVVPACPLVATVAASTVAPPLVDGAKTMVTLERDLASKTPAITLSMFGDVATRLATALGGGSPGTRKGDDTGSRKFFGRIAHADMPAFTSAIDDVPAPVMIKLSECLPSAPMQMVRDLGSALSFRPAAFAFASNDRIVGGVRLRSSIAGVALVTPATNDSYTVVFPVKLALSPRLGTTSLAETTDEGGAIGDAPRDLTFDLESGSGLRVDYFEVVLYELASARLVPIRTYVSPEVEKRTIRFDPTILTPGSTYVFAIRTYRGVPRAPMNDFTAVDEPQAVGTVFTRTFTR
ncbi:MAG TPA: hypothetical protein VK427_18680 [Kofleriaceae bacterium]|nr:hypothetical protein [Kofleriaceae bacterium]